MQTRYYLRSGVAGFTVAQQMTSAPEGAQIYCDDLPPRKLKERDPKNLEQRERMLKPTSRNDGEVIGIASLPVLGIDVADAQGALVKAHARNAIVIAYDTGKHYPPGMTSAEMAEMAADYTAKRKSGQTVNGRFVGVEAARIAKLERSEKALSKALVAWSDPKDIRSAKTIAREAGCSASFLYKRLGARAYAKAKVALGSQASAK